MSNIYNAKFMNEASATLSDKVLKRPVNETYLFSAMNILREMNSTIDKNTEKLYMQIAEAESKADENKLFANYFYEFKNIFSNFANKIEEMKSRMIISVENKVETWEDLIKDDAYIANFNKEFSYSGWNFSHMEDSNYPRLNLYKFYQKEFDYLGTLLQDKSIQASPNARMKIIATVSNNFSNSAADKGWIKCLIKEMIDIDQKESDKSYSECIYNSLRDKYEIAVNKSTLYTCKEALADYEDVTDAAIKLCDNLLLDLNRVAENISSYLFRNEDKKLIIKTETDGVIDRDYRLDTYAMNQLDLFLKNKVNQMRKLLNVYSIAIGIKFDTAVDYIEQNIDILRMAKEFNSDMKDAEEVDADDIVDDEDDDLDSDGVEDTSDDDDIEIPADDTVENPVEEEPEADNVEFDDKKETSFADDDLEAGLDKSTEDFEEAYLFETAIFELEMLQEAYNMNESIKAALLLEADEPSNQQSNLSNVQKIADKASLWQKLIQKLTSLWTRFKQVFVDVMKARIEYLKTNGKYTSDKLSNVSGTVKLKYTPKIEELNSLEVPDLNYDQMKDNLVSEEAFCKSVPKFNAYYSKKGEGNFSDAIKREILGAEQEINPNDTKFIKEAYAFCMSYEGRIKEVDKDMNTMKAAERAAKNVKNVSESAKINDFSKYFTEMEDNTNTSATSGGDTQTSGTTSAGNNEQKKSTNSDMSARLSVYFKVCSQVLATQMTLYQNIFNEYFTFCEWYITKAGGPSYKKGSSDNNQSGGQK